LFYKDRAAATPNLRDKIQKESDLLEQLEEAKNGDPADADPKAKGKKAGKAPEEIEAEIKSLLQPDISGWILIDFPRDIKQAKLLENSFTGYELVSDKPKPEKT
jgi:adenylate kinase family enzyme